MVSPAIQLQIARARQLDLLGEAARECLAREARNQASHSTDHWSGSEPPSPSIPSVGVARSIARRREASSPPGGQRGTRTLDLADVNRAL